MGAAERPGLVRLLLSNAQRIREWQAGLEAEGFHPEVYETRGEEAHKEDYSLWVPQSESFAAKRFVSDVLAGKRELPVAVRLSSPLMMAATLIVVAVAGLVLASLIFR